MFPFSLRSRGLRTSLWLLAAVIASSACQERSHAKRATVPTKPAPVKSTDKAWVDLDRVEIPIEARDGAEVALTRNFYFIFDGSGSMNEKVSGACGPSDRFSSKLDGAVWAVEQFMTSVPESVNLGLYTFDASGQGERLALRSGQKARFLDKVRMIRAGGKTPLAEAIGIATDRLVSQYKHQLGYGEFRIVVVTDGEAEDLDRAAKYAAAYGIPIYTIGLCVGASHPLRQYSVSYRSADNFEDLKRGLEATLAELPDFDVAAFE